MKKHIHKWSDKEITIRRYGNPIYVRTCKCGVAKALFPVDGAWQELTPEEAKRLIYG